MENEIFESKFFVVRNPLLPLDRFFIWDDLEGDPGTRLLMALRAAARDSDIREALFIGSPVLEGMLDDWLDGRLSFKKKERMNSSLVFYLTRMASRPTPFGLFATCTVGRWASDTCLHLQERFRTTRHTRLTMDYLCTLADGLERDRSIQEGLRYSPNSTMYPVDGAYRYYEHQDRHGAGRSYVLASVARSEALDLVLGCAVSGASIAELANSLSAGGVIFDAAKAFIHELIDNQILVSNLHPPVTGADPLNSVISALSSIAGARQATEALESARESMIAMDTSGVGRNPTEYREILKSLSRLPVELDPSKVFHVDLHGRCPYARLNRRVRERMLEGARLLWRLTPQRSNRSLERFKEAFQNRYQERWIPILEALDEEMGIGFMDDSSILDPGEALLEDLPIERPEGEMIAPWTGRSAVMLSRIMALGMPFEWELSDRDVKDLENDEAQPFPDAFCCFGALAGKNPESLDSGDFDILLEWFSGPSGARLLGRFCHGDSELAAMVKDHLAAEAALRPEALLAEVAHLPHGRLGNILCRPGLRPHEIPFLCAPGTDPEGQIPLQDIYISVRDGQIILRSARLGKEVVPRLTSAHNYRSGLAVYRFLCSLQDQACGEAGWSWGPLEVLPFLPRVRRGGHVLQRARWRVRAEELKGLNGTRDPQMFADFRRKRGIPRLAVLVEGDNEMFLDLDNPLYLQAFFGKITGMPIVRLMECFPAPEGLVMEGSDGRYCHQLLVPFVRKGPVSAPQKLITGEVGQEAGRLFPPGSEWLYLKLYGGVQTLDRILIQRLPRFLEAQSATFDAWFFLRYQDPEPHLRLRFHGRPDTLTGALLPALQEEFGPPLANGSLWRLQVDTYHRETERYGGREGVEVSELIFMEDSLTVLEILSQAKEMDVGWRWKMGLLSVESLLADMGFSREEKAGIIARARVSTMSELPRGETGRLYLDRKFRGERKSLECLLRLESDPGRKILDARSRRWGLSMDRLKILESSGLLHKPRTALALSYVHMHLNRLLRASQRAQEAVIWDFIGRLDRSRSVRAAREIQPEP